MNKKILFIIAAVFFSLALPAFGQESKIQIENEKSPVKSIISIDKNICSGKKFTLVSLLENTSSEDIVINVRSITQIRHEMFTAFGDDLLAGFKTRGVFSEIYNRDSPPKSFLKTLKPGEVYTYKYVIDTATDDFYKSAGKYQMQIVNWQPDDEKSNGESLFFGKVSSNELKFELKPCPQN